MKKILYLMAAFVMLLSLPALVLGIGRARVERATEGTITAADASAADTILPGVFIGPIDVSGLTEAEARAKVSAFVEQMKKETVTVNIGDHQEMLPVSEIGFTWVNTDAPKKALSYGKSGNILERYKIVHDLETSPYVIELQRSVDTAAIEEFLSEQIDKYEYDAVDAHIEMNEDGYLVVVPAENGFQIDRETSRMRLNGYLTGTWAGEKPVCSLKTEVEYGYNETEAMEKVHDVLGAYATEYTGAMPERATNVRNGGSKMNGITLLPGERYSTLSLLEPFTVENGYEPAPSYNSGEVEDSLGGGICQLASTLYMAVMYAELDVVVRVNHSLPVHYVKTSMDATVSDHLDFIFENSTEYPIYIFMNTDNEVVTARIYGVETRDPNREIDFESEVTEREEAGIKLIANNSAGFGYVKKLKSASDGIRSCLWKLVTENGETERIRVNTSHYNMVDETYEVGVVSGSETATGLMYSAVSANDLERVYSLINQYGTYDTGYSGGD